MVVTSPTGTGFDADFVWGVLIQQQTTSVTNFTNIWHGIDGTSGCTRLLNVMPTFTCGSGTCNGNVTCNGTTTSVTWNSSFDLDFVWHEWNEIRVNPQYETAEQREARIVAEEARRAREDDLRRRRAEEEVLRLREEKEDAERALNLLLSVLTPHQRETYEKHGYVPVVTKKGNIYHVEKGWSHNVRRYSDKKVHLETLCAHPIHICPKEDNVLGQVLMLENNEDEFRKVANISKVRAA